MTPSTVELQTRIGGGCKEIGIAIMFAKVEKFDSAWIGLSLEISNERIDALIARLYELKEEKIE